MMVNKERVQLLVDELRTTTKAQGRGSLKRNDEYCCLGIAVEKAIELGCVVDVKEAFYGTNGETLTSFDGIHDFMPESVRDWYGFETRNPIIADDNAEGCSIAGCTVPHSMITASAANDEMRWDFKKIGDGFEKMYLTERDNG